VEDGRVSIGQHAPYPKFFCGTGVRKMSWDCLHVHTWYERN